MEENKYNKEYLYYEEVEDVKEENLENDNKKNKFLGILILIFLSNKLILMLLNVNYLIGNIINQSILAIMMLFFVITITNLFLKKLKYRSTKVNLLFGVGTLIYIIALILHIRGLFLGIKKIPIYISDIKETRKIIKNTNQFYVNGQKLEKSDEIKKLLEKEVMNKNIFFISMRKNFFKGINENFTLENYKNEKIPFYLYELNGEKTIIFSISKNIEIEVKNYNKEYDILKKYEKE